MQQNTKVLKIDHEKCTGCRTCEQVCVLMHDGVINPMRSRIRVVKWDMEGLYIPMTCQQCQDAPCLNVCPVKAYYKRDRDGIVVHDEQRNILLVNTAVEKLTGVSITAESLKTAIRTVNAKRAAIHRLSSLRKADPAPITGLDALLANQVFFYDNPARFTESLNKICDELEKRIADKKGVAPEKTPRLLMSGCPMAVPNWKLPWIVETSGAVIVGAVVVAGWFWYAPRDRGAGGVGQVFP